MLTRIIVGGMAAAVIVAAFLAGSKALLVLLSLLSVLIAHEMLHVLKRAGKSPILSLGYGFAALVVPAYFFFGAAGIMALYGMTVICAFFAGFLQKQPDSNRIFSTLLFLAYPFLLLCVVLLCVYPETVPGRTAFALGVACACGSDILAYFGGMLLGKRKLCPDISPNKTVEGAISGLFGGIAGGCLIWAVQKTWGGGYSFMVYCIFGVILSVAAQTGDLAASMIKRACSIKDFGHILPGHGGILDRVDSNIFSIPCAYIMLRLITG